MNSLYPVVCHPSVDVVCRKPVGVSRYLRIVTEPDRDGSCAVSRLQVEKSVVSDADAVPDSITHVESIARPGDVPALIADDVPVINRVIVIAGLPRETHVLEHAIQNRNVCQPCGIRPLDGRTPVSEA